MNTNKNERHWRGAEFQTVFLVVRYLLTGMLVFGSQGRAECLGADEGFERVEVPSRSARAHWILDDPITGVERAMKLVGLAKETSQAPVPFLAIITADATPFLGKTVVGRHCWVVTMTLPKGAVGASFKQTERTFDVFLDATSGQVVKIVSRLPPDATDLPALATPEQAEKEMLETGEGVYDGFPEDPPRVTFREALETVEKSSFASVPSAKQIIGHFVKIRTPGNAPVRRWVIMLRGVPPVMPRHWMPKTSNYQYRVIVNADTGKYIYLTNIPHPQHSRRWLP